MDFHESEGVLGIRVLDVVTDSDDIVKADEEYSLRESRVALKPRREHETDESVGYLRRTLIFMDERVSLGPTISTW